jgi:hypothetical protein
LADVPFVLPDPACEPVLTAVVFAPEPLSEVLAGVPAFAPLSPAAVRGFAVAAVALLRSVDGAVLCMGALVDACGLIVDLTPCARKGTMA